MRGTVRLIVCACLGVLLTSSAGYSAAGVPSMGAARPQRTDVVVLKYADISEIVGILISGESVAPNDVFAPTGSVFSLPTSTSGGNAPGATSNQPFNPSAGPPQALGQRINDTIAVDRRLNAVILSGTPAELAQLESMIAKLDVPVPSVLLECQVFELSEAAARDAGIELSSTGAAAGGGFQSVSGQVATSSGSLQAQVFAQITRGAGRLLATPRIVAQNGNPASILSGNALPIVTTTIFPGTSLSQQTVNYIAVGVNLQIQPRVSIDGNVISHIFSEVSSVTQFVPTAQGDVPQISLRQAATSATVPDGQLFIIGGLSRETEIRNFSRIPILGYLPLIGALFRVRHDTAQRVNLYIAITPHIIHESARVRSQPEPPTVNPSAEVTKYSTTSRLPMLAKRVAFVGRWEFAHDRRDGRFEGASARSFNVGDTLHTRFTGKHLRIYGVTGPNGGYGLLNVDGKYNIVNFYSPAKRTHALLYANWGLSRGIHSIALSIQSSHDRRSRGTYVNVDDVEPAQTAGDDRRGARDAL